MSQNMGTINPSEMQVKHSVELLLHGTSEERKKAAAELHRLGVWMRGSVRPRGSLATTAPNRLPVPDKLPSLIECLADADAETRCGVALTLGEWGDQSAAEALCRMLASGDTEKVQLYVLTALRTIGGPAAVKGLSHGVAQGSETVRDAALSAIEELATGGRLEDTENVLPMPPSAISVIMKREGLCAGGRRRASRRAAGEDVISGVVNTLRGLRDDQYASEYLRLRANEILGYFRA